MASKKKVNKISKQQIRESARQLRASISAQEKQLRAIERLLDDEFDSLNQARRELKRNTVQVKRTSKAAIRLTKGLANVFRDAFSSLQSKGKSQPVKKVGKPKSTPPRAKKSSAKTPVKLVPSKSALNQPPVGIIPRKGKPSPNYTKTPVTKVSKPFTKSRSLKGKKGETTLELFERLKGYGEDVDQLLKPGERWTFTYGKGKAKRLYGTFQQAVSRMEGYKLSQSLIGGLYDDDDRAIDADLVASITITKTGEGAGSYADRREMENKKREAERKRIQRAGRKVLEDAGVNVPSRFGGSIDLTEALIQQSIKDKARIAELEAKQPSVKGKKKSKTK